MCRDAEDHISWLLQHGFHEKALAAVEAGNGHTKLLDEVCKRKGGLYLCHTSSCHQLTFMPIVDHDHTCI